MLEVKNYGIQTKAEQNFCEVFGILPKVEYFYKLLFQKYWINKEELRASYVSYLYHKNEQIKPKVEKVYKRVTVSHIPDVKVFKLMDILIEHGVTIYYNPDLREYECSTDTEHAEFIFGFGTCNADNIKDLILYAFCKVQSETVYDKVKELFKV